MLQHMVSSFSVKAAGGAVSTPPTLDLVVDKLFRVVNYAFGVVGIVLLMVIIMGGFMRIAAGSNPQNVAKANNTLLWGFVGAAIVLLSVIIVNMVGNILGYTGDLSVINIP